MAESRIVATERLRREGRWDEASTYRDEVRRKFKAEKKPRSEANDAAWDAMIAQFPPLPVADPENVDSLETSIEEDAADFDALVDRAQGNPPDVDRDALWVYEHLDVRGAVPDDAPSMGAWSMLKWGRENRDRFFEQMLPKAMASTQKRKGAGGTDGAGRDDEIVEDDLEEIEEWFRALARGVEQGMVDGAPQAIIRRVYELVPDWCRAYQLSISREATVGLASRMIELADICVQAAMKDPELFRRKNPRPWEMTVKELQAHHSTNVAD